jgi:hypothetical protein
MVSLFKSPFICNNYKKIIINVIIICFIFILTSCEASEKAEKLRLDNAYKTVSLIPPTQEESEYFQQSFEKQPPPSYPF